MVNKLRRKVPPDEALSKAERYCSNDERCVSQVEKKLFEWGVKSDKSQEIIDHLVEHDFINELRFAQAYVRGKIRINKWGRLKIIASLRSKGLVNSHIDQAIKGIYEPDYLKMLEKILEEKMKTIQESNPQRAKNKIYYFLMSRGFESSLIREALFRKNPMKEGK